MKVSSKQIKVEVREKMNSKELVKRAIEFRRPERVPYNFDSGREGYEDKSYGDDFVWVYAGTDPEFVPKVNSDTEYEDEFGVIYQKMGNTFGEAKYYPLGDNADIDAYITPDFSNPLRYIELQRAVDKNPDKYIMGMFPHFLFLTMIDLFGFENLMIEMMDDREKVERVADLLTESCIRVVKSMADRGVDGIIAIEDLGVQDRLIISPTLWRQIFKPRYAKIFTQAHKMNVHILFHSCGYIVDLIDDLIEIGVDVLQIDQQDNMGIDKLAHRFAGKICFFSPVDIQTTLPCGSEREIEDKAKHLIKAFGSNEGGFIAKMYNQPLAINVPEKNMECMCEAFKRNAVYPLSF